VHSEIKPYERAPRLVGRRRPRLRWLFPRGAPRSGVSDQQYVYTTHELDPNRGLADLESIVNEYAREGWRLTETVARDGSTLALVFEREV